MLLLAFAHLDLVVEGQCPGIQGEAHLEMVHPISRWGWLRAYIQVFQRRLAPPGYGAPPRGAPMYGRVEPISRLSNHLQHSGELGLACTPDIITITLTTTTIITITIRIYIITLTSAT